MLFQQIGSGFGQHAAGRHDARHPTLQRLPVARFAQTVQHRRAGDPQRFFISGGRGQQGFGIHVLRPVERPTHRERQRETESEAVHMLRADAADNNGVFARKRHGFGQRRRFGLHLRGGFHHNLRFAAGAGGFQTGFCTCGNPPISRRFGFGRRGFQQGSDIPNLAFEAV